VLEGRAGSSGGTDTYGRDIFADDYGRPISLTVGFLSVLLGWVSGSPRRDQRLFRVRLDGWLMRIMTSCWRSGILRHCGGGLLGPGIVNVIYAIAVSAVPVFARLGARTTLD